MDILFSGLLIFVACLILGLSARTKNLNTSQTFIYFTFGILSLLELIGIASAFLLTKLTEHFERD